MTAVQKMKWFLWGFAAGTLVVLMIIGGVAPAQAQQTTCLPRAQLLEKLRQNFREEPVFRGIALKGAALVEVYLNFERGNFSVVITQSNGISCLAVAGKDGTLLPTIYGDLI